MEVHTDRMIPNDLLPFIRYLSIRALITACRLVHPVLTWGMMMPYLAVLLRTVTAILVSTVRWILELMSSKRDMLKLKNCEH